MPGNEIDRRTFLTKAGTGLAAPLMLGCASSKSRPQPDRARIPPSEQITIGFIGMGIRSRNLLRRSFLTDPRLRVLAVCDVDRTRRLHFKGVVDKHYANPDCEAYVDYRDLLARADIDAVVIATPDHWHATQCVHAAQAGKDIYCEKPLTHTLAEGRRLIEVVRSEKRVFQTGSQQRSEYGHKFVQAVEYVRNGRLGELLSIHVGVGSPPKACDLGEERMEPGLDWDRWLGPAPLRPYNSILSPRGLIDHYPRWRRYREYSGGYLADMGAHHFDIVQWALDADRSGPVEALPPPRQGAERGVRLRYANGPTVTHGGPGGVTFIGTEGMIAVDRGRIHAFPERLFKKPIGADELRLPRNESHVADWIRCIKSRETPICDVEIGARTAAVCQLANLAYRYGQRIAWAPVEWKFEDESHSAWMDYDRRQSYDAKFIS